MTATPFDPTAAMPAGVTVLEASAGTGKTHAIEGLVVRCVADDMRLPELLVVTFTRAATAELRDRVRSRLVRAADHVRRRLVCGGAPPTDDPVLAHLADADEAALAARHHRLVTALAEFDAATITTIHGFCQHMLAGVGLSGDVDADATFLTDHRDLVDGVVDDVLVRHVRDRDGVGDAEAISREELRAVAREVVDNPDAAIVPRAPADPVAAQRVALASRVRAEVERRKRASGVLSYDDLLTRLAGSLRDPDRGPVARRRLQRAYRAVLVDEFQDTDPIQWEIIQRAFGGDGHPVVLIGDPKQAIYAFRGADVYAYLGAVEAASQHRTLNRNWRCDAALLRALDALLHGTRFGDEAIAYRPVEAADAHRIPGLVDAPRPAPLRLRALRRDAPLATTANGKYLEARAARRHLARDLAGEITELLASKARLVDRDRDGTELGRRPVRPGDLAVLVRSNAEAALVQRTLREAGVPAVINGVGSVFATPAATEWLRLLEALERPSAPARARAAALTAFLGWSAEDVATTEDWDGLHRCLHRWAAIVRDRGVAALVHALATEQRLPERLLAEADGERRLTDLLHVGELAHAAAVDGDLGLTALAGWLRDQLRTAEDTPYADERARRLESDAEAVQVLTIHRSKGLEFPIVYCPYLWSAAPVNTQVPLFHDPELAGPHATGSRVADVGGPNDPDYEGHQKQARREQHGEGLRLLYVALTRARHQVVVWWAPVAGNDEAPLARVLFCRRRDGRVNAQAKASFPDDDHTISRLEAIAADADGTIGVETVPADPRPMPWRPDQPDAGELAAAAFDRRIDERWGRTSYTSLTTGAAAASGVPRAAGQAAAAVPGSAAWPDHAAPVPLAEVPGGAEVGTFVHTVLEHTDFAAADLDGELARVVDEQHRRSAIDLGGASAADGRARLVDGLRRALETPLGTSVDDLRLCDLARRDRLDEVDFELPLAGGATPTGTVTVAAVGELLGRYLAADDPLAGYAGMLTDPAWQREVRGYLTGSLDLVLRVGGDRPRFAVADYKTNVLAVDEPLTPWHYRPAALAEAMHRGHYPLQALFYLVALHRYLRWRLAGYDPDRDLAGVMYLFLRGMTGAEAPRVDGRPCGVFAWRPPSELVVAVADLLDRGTDRR